MEQDSNKQPEQNSARFGHITGSRVTAPLPELRYDWAAPYTPAAAPTTVTPVIQPVQKRSGGVSGVLIAVVLIIGMLIGGGITGAGLLISGVASGNAANNRSTTGSVAPEATATTATASAPNQSVAQIQPNTVSNIYNKLSPSVVRIDTIIGSQGAFGGGGQGTGSGIVLDKQGNILTNNHVISGATRIKIELSDGSQYDGTVVGTAPQDDMAVVKTNAPADKLIPAELGDSSTLQPGASVIAIGYPFGFDQSVTSGIISGLNRDYSSTSSRTIRGLIQTDAAINPGNSGGPLLNDQGQVIGVNTLIESPVEAFTGIGLAIPINRAKSLIPQLEQGGELQRPWIGVSGTEITPDVKAQLGLTVDAGIAVMDVIAGGPAEKAGLKPADVAQGQSTLQPGDVHDVITAVDGQAVGSIAELTGYLDGKKPGDKVTLSVVRDGSPITIDVSLEPWPATTTTTDQQNPTNP